MKRILAVLVVLLLCTTLICPALAADNSFVPSISEKDHPKLVPVRDTDGSIMHDEHGHVVVGLACEIVYDAFSRNSSCSASLLPLHS